MEEPGARGNSRGGVTTSEKKAWDFWRITGTLKYMTTCFKNF